MFKRSLIAGAVLSVSLGAHAVGANISVTGTVTPDACTIALGNNGNVDYGTLTASVVRSYDLWFGTHYTLPNKDIAIEVNCPSATRVGLSVLDNRATTKENGLTRPGIKFGLGLSGTQPIGFYEIQTHSIQIGLTRGGTPNNAGSSLIRDMSGGPWIYQSSDVPSGYPAHSSPQVAGWPQPRANTYAYVNLSIPLGDSITSTSYARRTNDETRYGTALDQRVNDMLDYRLSVDRVADRPTTETSGSVHALPRYASTSLGITDRQNGGRSYYAEITGSLLATSAGWGFSPYAVQDTFGVVRTGDVVGLKVMTPQGPVWSGPGGSAAVPSLQAYRPSRVEASLDAGAIDIDVGNPLQVVQPGRGAVVRMEMDARRVRRVLLGVVDALGRPLPKGLPVLRRNGALFSSTAQGGRVMVDHMTEGVPLYVELAPGRRCLLQDIRTRPRAADGLFESGSAVCR